MRELSETITRTALSACADLVCTLTPARIGRSSWRREILGHAPLGYAQREDNLFEARNKIRDAATTLRPACESIAMLLPVQALGVGIARSGCKNVQSGAIGCRQEAASLVEDWIQNAYPAWIAAGRVPESSC